MVKHGICMILGVLLSISLFSQADGKDCKGFFRWDVKTLTDRGGAELLQQKPADTAMLQLLSVHPPRHFFVLSKKDGRLPRFEDEKLVVKVVALIVSVKTERDQDLHITLQSPDSKDFMISEIPDPACRLFDTIPALREAYTKARMQLAPVTDLLNSTKKPVLVEITGVPFWDARHWWLRGCARNGRELHPVLSVKILPTNN